MPPVEPETTSQSSPASSGQGDATSQQPVVAGASADNVNEEKDLEVQNRTISDDSAATPPLPDEKVPSLPNEPPPSGSPPLADESLPTSSNDAPPLPDEAPPGDQEDDGWQPVWEESMKAFYFYNRFTGATQWTNPRVPEDANTAEASTSTDPSPMTTTDEASSSAPIAGGYNPAIHGDYDPNAWYAKSQQPIEEATRTPEDLAAMYSATGAFNRFTGKWQDASLNPENFSDESKSRRQLSAYYDVDAATQAHDGRSLRAERSNRKLTKSELKQFKEKRKAKKEERRRAWLMD